MYRGSLWIGTGDTRRWEHVRINGIRVNADIVVVARVRNDVRIIERVPLR